MCYMPKMLMAEDIQRGTRPVTELYETFSRFCLLSQAGLGIFSFYYFNWHFFHPVLIHMIDFHLFCAMVFISQSYFL